MVNNRRLKIWKRKNSTIEEISKDQHLGLSPIIVPLDTTIINFPRMKGQLSSQKKTLHRRDIQFSGQHTSQQGIAGQWTGSCDLLNINRKELPAINSTNLSYECEILQLSYKEDQRNLSIPDVPYNNC